MRYYDLLQESNKGTVYPNIHDNYCFGIDSPIALIQLNHFDSTKSRLIPK